MMKKDDLELAGLFRALLKVENIDADKDYVAKVMGMLKERATFITDIWEQGYYFFKAPDEYDAKTVKKRWKAGVPEIMTDILGFLKAYQGEWEAAPLKEQFSAFVTEKEWGFGVVMNAFRLCIVGAALGADLFEICEMIGRDETLGRIEKALATLKV